MRTLLVISSLLLATALADGPELGKPFAVLDGRTRVTPGSTVEFSAESSFDTDGTIVSYTFALGDQVIVNRDGRATFSFPRAGVYFLELEVVDDAGLRAHVRQPIFVESAGELLRRRLLSRERRGALLLMCELQDAATSESIENLGDQLLAPLLRLGYGEVQVLRGEGANPEDFFAGIRGLCARRDAVDVFLFAHGSPGKLWLKNRRSVSGEDILRELDGRADGLRMVYSTLCWGESMNQAWRQVGAEAASGAVDVHIPVEAPPFLLGWLAGQEYSSLTGRCFQLNRQAHDLRNQLAVNLEPMLRQMQGDLGESDVENALEYYLEWFLQDGEWEIWKSTPLIEGGGVTIDTFPEDLAPSVSP